MTTERIRTVKGLLEEHRRRRAATKGRRKRSTRSLSAQIPSMNPVMKHYAELGINPKDFRERV